MAPSGYVRATRPTRIEVDGGRINFKQGDTKSPFALVDVTGRVEQSDAGRWQLDLEAAPMRAGVELQDIGTLRLRGSIAGTSSRLQPADLNLTWRAASLADALRIFRQNDYGMRGQIALDLHARIGPAATPISGGAESSAATWSVSVAARLTGIHGWRLPGRGTDPAANVLLEMNWKLGDRRAEIPKLLVELPASHLQGRAELEWARGFEPQLQIDPSTIALSDALSWYRALRPDVADDLKADGLLNVNLKLGGWPLQAQQGTITSAGGAFTAKAIAGSLKIGELKAAVSHGEIDFAPTVISMFSPRVVANPDSEPDAGAARNSFVLQGSLLPRANGEFRWPLDWTFSVEGSTAHVQDWVALSSAFAQPVNSGWTASGGLAVKMRGTRLAVPPIVPGVLPATTAWAIPWRGTMDFTDFTLAPAYLNQPLRVPRAHVEFAPLQRTVTLADAEAFGAMWHGSVGRKYSDAHWTFDLSADHLDALELDRWLGPRARTGFLARFTGLNSAVAASPEENAVVRRLAARGRLRVASLDIPPMHLARLDGEAEIAGREIQIRRATADFFGGKISGALDAQLLPDPTYEFDGRADRVDLADLGAAVPFLADRLGGTASGALRISAHGIGRESLVGSLRGQGSLTGRNVQLRGLNLSAVFPGAASEDDAGTFATVAGNYRIENGGIELAGLVLDHHRGRLQAEGRIDFNHALNLRVRPSIFQAAANSATVSPPAFVLGGTIESPKVLMPSASPKPAARGAVR